MTMLLRAVLAVLLTAWISLPATGSEGGGNAGGTGVWILPRATYLCSSQLPTTAPKSQFSVPTLQQDLSLQLDDGMGMAVATLVDDVAGAVVPLQVTGNLAVVPAALLQGLGSAPTPTATVMISDAAHLGYLIRLTVNASTNTCVVAIY